MPKPDYNRISAGFTLGDAFRVPHLVQRGPNMFVAYQGTCDHIAAIDAALEPTEAEREGQLLNVLGQSSVITDPSTGKPFPGCVVPVSAQTVDLLKLYPLPNISGNPLYNYQVPVLNSSHQDIVQLRMDKTMGLKDQLYGNLNLQSMRAGNVSLFDFLDTTDRLGLNTNLYWSHEFNRGLFLYISYHFSRLRTLVRPKFENKQDIEAEAGIGSVNPDPTNWGPRALNFTSGIAAHSDAQSAFNGNRTNRLSSSLGNSHGRHDIMAGGDLRKQDYKDFFQQEPRGTFNFTGAVTGSDLADFLIGIPDARSIAFSNAEKYLRQTVCDAYATDDWRVLPSLTIDAGVQRAYCALMTELFGSLVNLVVTSGFTQAAPVLSTDPIGPLTGPHYLGSLVRPYRLGIEPRVGISWRPIPASTVVIHAGYGIYQGTSVYLAPVLKLAQQPPLSTPRKLEYGQVCPLTLANSFPNCGETVANIFAIDPNLRVGFAQTWQLSAQCDLPGAMQGVLTYLGVKGTHGVEEFLPNSYPLDAADPCPDCPSGFAYETSGGNSTVLELTLLPEVGLDKVETSALPSIPQQSEVVAVSPVTCLNLSTRNLPNYLTSCSEADASDETPSSKSV